MRGDCLVRWCLRLAILAAVWTPWTARAADFAKRLGPADPSQETVDFFSAVQKGQISAQVIPRDAWQCRLLVSNKTDKPLNVRLPDVLAAAPVSAQILPPFGNNGTSSGNQPGGRNSPQALGLSTPMGTNVGGPMNNRNPLMNMPNAGNRRGNQGLLFNIAPEITGQLKIASLCLEYGKPTPKANIPYQLLPIESVADKAEVQEVVRMLGQGEVGHRAAQAAVWYLNNGLTWEKLQAQKAVKLAIVTQPMFTPRELADAKKAVEQAAKRCKQGPPASPTQSAGR